MKRRVAADEERCTQKLGRGALWKARRRGQVVEERCSRTRQGDSPFCLWHQPDRVETRRSLPNEAAVAIYAEVVEMRLRYGPPPIGKAWWGVGDGDNRDLRLVVPSLEEFAKAHDISANSLSDMLRGKQYQSIGFIRERFGWWKLSEVVAALLWLRRQEGGFPGPSRYRALKLSGAAIPDQRSLIRHFGEWSRVSLITGIPSTARHRHWTPEEDDYLMDRIGLVPISAIAHTLHRSFPSIKERVRTMGATIYSAQGYLTLAEAVRSYGVTQHQLRTAVLSGRLPYVEGAKEHGHRLIFLDPLDVEAWLERRSGGLLMAGGSE